MANAFTAAAAKATAANEARYAQGMGLWDEIIKRYQPGGGFGTGALASYERGKTKAVGAGMQQLVSSGLANTTVAATIGKKYEEEVGTPFKLQLQDVQSQRLSEAQAGQAGFIERRTDAYPDPGLAASLGSQVGYAQGMQRGGYGGMQDSYSLPGFGTTTSDTKQPTTTPGITGPAFRAGEAYDPGAGRADIGRITYQGEPSRAAEFSPTGTGGEAKGDTAYQKYLQDYAERIKPTMMSRGFSSGELTPHSLESFTKRFGSTYRMPDEVAAAKKKTGSVGTTSYAAKGGGFGGRGF